jgi:hypothetical protein
MMSELPAPCPQPETTSAAVAIPIVTAQLKIARMVGTDFVAGLMWSDERPRRARCTGDIPHKQRDEAPIATLIAGIAGTGRSDDHPVVVTDEDLTPMRAAPGSPAGHETR